jgi:hypothetical protein
MEESLFLVAMLLQTAVSAPPDGAAREIDVPRAETSVEIDGVLDEAIWRDAARLGSFTQYLPVDGRPARDSTVVLVWYSPTAIHFGIRASSSGGTVRATLSDRDRIDNDDFVHLLLDTFDDQRQAFLFGVNPLGVQADGVLRDRSRQAASFGSAGDEAAYEIDLSPDYVFESKGRVTQAGYEIEIRIPFKSIRYQPGREQVWGFNVIRKVQYSGYEDTWSPVRRASASFLSQSGRLAGLVDLRRGLVLDITPEATSSVRGTAELDGWDYSANDPELGANVRWGITNNLALNGTVNPDFSQVEADVAQIQFDPRRAVFFPEKRPFFLEGIEQFSTPNSLIYTRRLVDPTGAAKLTGKISGTNIALLSGVDDCSTSPDADRPFYNMVRLRRDLSGQSVLGLAYTDKVDGNDFNRVVAVDGRLVFGGIYAVTFQAGGSVTRQDEERVTAPIWQLSFNRAGRHFGLNYSMTGIHPDFSAQSGFISRAGVVNASLQPSLTRFGAPGASLERWTGSISLSGTWDYERFVDGRTPNDPKLHLNSGFTFRGGWRLGASVLIESFKYPPALYDNYFIERTTAAGVDTIPHIGTDRLYNLDLVMSVATPQFQNFSGSLRVIAGRDENFFEWAPANVFFVTLDTDWRPSDKIRINLLYNHQQYIRPSDWSTVGQRRVPRLKVEYQLSRAIFLRLVGQYDAQQQDDLRDNSRTEDPILLYDASTDAFARAVAQRTNDFRLDWLFSYRPNPGTVFFAGYGSSLSEPRPFRFSALERRSDGFFLKASYLFRM